MSYVHVNGAQIYYDLYGARHPDSAQAPVLLIHGAGETGQSTWGDIAPLLARHYQVIVPDCRGHGRSTNPQHNYSFREMAADLADLVRRLGHERAQLVGCGHGGSVALVALLEYPEIVQTCTLEGTHAVVDPGLEGAWARLYDPEWLDAQDPDRASRFMALHSPMHGLEHWRELLSLALEETLHQPTYTPEDLALVRRPVLVMQGGRDGIHALSGDGEFLARHIPDAETWFPLDAGPEIHREQPWPWLLKLLAFLDRRGDNANEALERLRRNCYPDPQETVFGVRAVPVSSRQPGWAAAYSGEAGGNGESGDEVWWAEPSPVRLVGKVLNADQRQAARVAVEPVVWKPELIVDEVNVLLDEATPWALVSSPLVDLRTSPESDGMQGGAPVGFAGRVSQVLVGEAVRVLEEEDGWAHVRLEREGCLGWLQAATLQPCTADEVETLQAAAGAAGGPIAAGLVTAGIANAYARPRRSALMVGKLAMGTTLPIIEQGRGWTALRLPDGERWWLPAADVLPVADRPAPGPVAVSWALSLLRNCVGAPLLPGGASPFGFDSPGLAGLFLRLLGLPAPRTIPGQYKAGQPVDGLPQPGDLLFFAHEAVADSTRLPGASVLSHVAISLDGYSVLQAGGGSLAVNVLLLDPPRTPAARWLSEHLAGIRRFDK